MKREPRAPKDRRNPLHHILMRMTRLWNQEHSLSLFSGFLIGSVFIVQPLAALGLFGQFVTQLIMSLILISGVLAIAEDRRMALIAATVAVLSITSHCAAYLYPYQGLIASEFLCSMMSMAFLAGVVLAHVFKAGDMTFHRIQGAVAAYLLLGLAWAYAYCFVVVFDPTAFNPPQPMDTAEILMPKFVYFSFVTLTTTGYGDMTPVHPFARSLTILESLVGQLYPAILIARLVSLELQARLVRKH